MIGIRTRTNGVRRRETWAALLMVLMGAAGVLVGVGPAAAVVPAWRVQSTPNPSPTTLHSVFSSVSCPSATMCLAVGSNSSGHNTALAERWNGKKWRLEPLPKPSTWDSMTLNSVSCTSPTFCMAVGTYRDSAGTKLLAARWSGKGWKLSRPSYAKGARQLVLAGISCTSVSACLAVGSYLRVSTCADSVCKESVAFADRWTGSKWRYVRVPPPFVAASDLSAPTFAAVSCTSATRCMAVGSAYESATARQEFVGLAEKWNGTHWAALAAPGPGATDLWALSSVSCARSSLRCVAVGDYKPHNHNVVEPEALSYNGSTWHEASPPPLNFTGNVNGGLQGVSCSAAKRCMAVGFYTAPPRTSSVTLAERWNGTAWAIVPSRNDAHGDNVLMGVSCSASNTCTAVGDHEAPPLGVPKTLAERYS
jgi:hypothetical protein